MASFEGIELSDIKFVHDLHHPNLGSANRTIKIVTAGGWQSAFVKPALFRNNYKSCKVNFKIKQVTSNGLMLGVCQTPPNFKITDTYIYSTIQHGVFTYFNNSVYVGKS